MCKIDFDHELGKNWRGNIVYPDKESLLEQHNCANSCGIVKVEIKEVETIVETHECTKECGDELLEAISARSR